MRNLTDSEFIHKRRRLTAWWNRAGLAMLVFLAGAFGWLLLRTPLLVNPFLVQQGLSDRQLHWSTVESLAVTAPVIMGLLFAVTATLILFGYGAVSVERRYLRIIDSLRRDADSE